MMITREPEILPEATSARARVGRLALQGLRDCGRCGELFALTLLSLRHALGRRARHETVVQMYVAGIKSLGVISVVAVFTGMILALQTGIALRDYHQEANIGTAVMVSMLREMGPFMTGLILAACVGSAIAAQIGTMVVSDEVAALEIMSIEPVRFLVMPRLVAMMVMTPLLSFYTCMMGVLGGGLVGISQLGLSWTTYIDNATRWAEVKDLYVGMLKALVFGVTITVVASHEGFSTSQGAVGVGFATRKSVIVSFLMILIFGYVLTRLFYY